VAVRSKNASHTSHFNHTFSARRRRQLLPFTLDNPSLHKQNYLSGDRYIQFTQIQLNFFESILPIY
jgi:hypothetical protein